jgi:CubicO group peptidase (beta-lactamase class C family)
MKPDRFTQKLNNSLKKHTFSGVISIRQREAVLYEKAAGYAERSLKVKNTLETRFGIASGTKFFTALAIGKLIEAGKLAFSTRLKDCLVLDFPRYSPEITIGHLLTHTSGIPDYYDEEKVEDFDNFTVNVPWYDLKGPRDYLPVFPDEPMKFEPGERFSYSNGGYILLGVVIEELTGEKYQNFVTREVFQAAGMTRSGFFPFNQLPENTATGYVEEESGWRTNIYNLPIIGASDGGAYTTVQDVAALWQAFWAGKILSKELVEQYTQPQVKAEAEGEGIFYGHGLWIREDAGGSREEYFVGCDAGVSFKSSVNREKGLQVTVLSNTTDGAWPVLREIRAALKDKAGA